MELHIAQPFIHFLNQNPHYAGLIAAAITFFESLAVIGTLIPGSVTLTTMGGLIGSGTIPATSTILYIGMGAFLGDFISYGLGRHYKSHITSVWPFTRYPKLLNKSRHFCKKHGGKSIFIGRFTGPMRSFVPLITGVIEMPMIKFIGAALLSAFAWVIAFLIPGICLGALSHEIPAKIATEFIVTGLAVILLTWFILWCLTNFFEQISQAMQDLCQLIWHCIRSNRTGLLLSKLIANAQQPTSALPLLRCLIILCCLSLFATIWVFVHSPTLGFPIDQPIYHLLQSIRIPSLDTMMVALTLLGKHYTIELASLGILIWLCYQRQFRYASCLSLGLITTIGAIWTCKHFWYVARPNSVLHASASSSFPSGHVTISTSIITLLAIWLKDHMQAKWRWLPLSTATFVITLIAISRLYLGAHWLSDVFAGILLGLSIAHATLLVFWRNPPASNIHHRPFALVVVLSFLCAWIGYGYGHYQQVLRDSTPIYHLQKVDVQQWWQGESLPPIPLVRSNRFGQPDLILNIQWVGQAQVIAALMQQNGWKLHPTGMTFDAAMHRLTAREALPLLPKLYQNKPPALLFTSNHGQPLIMRLWQSNTMLDQTKNVLWLGTIGIAKQRQHIFNIHTTSPDQYQSGQLDVLEKSLQKSSFEWKIRNIKPNKKTIQSLHWDQHLIFIRPKEK